MYQKYWVVRRVKQPISSSCFEFVFCRWRNRESSRTGASRTPGLELTCFIYEHYFPSTFLWEKKMQKLKFINSKHPHLKENVSNIFLEWKKWAGLIFLPFLRNGSWNSDFLLLEHSSFLSLIWMVFNKAPLILLKGIPPGRSRTHTLIAKYAAIIIFSSTL